VKDDMTLITPQPVCKFLVYILLLFLVSFALCPQQKVLYILKPQQFSDINLVSEERDLSCF